MDTKASGERIAALGMSPRQQELNRLWAYYRCAQYGSRMTDWNGSTRPTPLDKEVIASAGVLPPGFVDANRQLLPIAFRYPSVQYHLSKVIVDRFTGLLFSESAHPIVRVDGDPDSEDYAVALITEAHLWSAMVLARTYGGAMGSVALGFKFVDGRPVVEVHDPRWLTPEFVDRDTFRVARIEKRYYYPMDVRDSDTGVWTTVNLWYRRVIDSKYDIVFKPVAVEQTEGNGEPNWEVAEAIEHGHGFCPVVWIQNLPVQDDADGDPDCQGIHELTEDIDALFSQANRGTIGNCDPTLHVAADGERPPSLAKGSDNAIFTPAGASVKYVEIGGSGPDMAMKMAERLRQLALEVAQCVLEHPDVAHRTATEVERVYGSMLQKADILRTQYGDKGIRPLVSMMMDASRRLIEAGKKVILPPRNKGDDEKPDWQPRSMGTGGVARLQWMGYFQPGLVDADQATKAAVSAKQGGVIDDETAVKFVATYFHVTDPTALVRKLRDAEKEKQLELIQSMMGQTGGDDTAAPAPAPAAPAPVEDMPAAPTDEAYSSDNPPPFPDPPPSANRETLGGAAVLGDYNLDALKGMEFYQYEIEGGIVTINEVRASKGLPPIVDGSMTLPQFRAKNAKVYAMSAAANSATPGVDAVEQALGTPPEAEQDAPESAGGRARP